ncbi:hypothetical protein LSA03nite_08890 [Latilactobacillus sakei subsp. carnosus]|nr:hypothetical protein LASAK_00204 [Latilactobacillus sakei]GEP21301.1 hypothetical protein LSA03nite_08890 [Latilactobacillus sakei subsp. carnosus]
MLERTQIVTCFSMYMLAFSTASQTTDCIGRSPIYANAQNITALNALRFKTCFSMYMLAFSTVYQISDRVTYPLD